MAQAADYNYGGYEAAGVVQSRVGSKMLSAFDDGNAITDLRDEHTLPDGTIPPFGSTSLGE